MTNSVYKGIFNKDKAYPSFSVVTYNDLDTESSVAVQVLMISTRPVPVGSDIKDANYWLPYNVENVNMLGAKSGIGYDEVAKMIQESEADIRADIETLKQKVATLEQEQEALSGTVEGMNGELTNVKDGVTNLDTEMAGVQADVLELKNKPDYVLPVASDTRLGGVIIGSGLSVDEFGRVSVTGGGQITVDDRISSVSENPVQNKVIEKYLEPVLGKVVEKDANVVNLSYSIPRNEACMVSAVYTYESNASPQYFEFLCTDTLPTYILIKFGVYNGRIALFVHNNSTTEGDIFDVNAMHNGSQYSRINRIFTNGSVGSYHGLGSAGDLSLHAGKTCVISFTAVNETSLTFTGFSSIKSIGDNFNTAGITPEYFVAPTTYTSGVPFTIQTVEVNSSEQPAPLNVKIQGEYPVTPWEQIQEDVNELKNKTLPIASASTVGCVKIGQGLSVTEDGTISVKLGTGLQFDENGNIVLTQ